MKSTIGDGKILNIWECERTWYWNIIRVSFYCRIGFKTDDRIIIEAHLNIFDKEINHGRAHNEKLSKRTGAGCIKWIHSFDSCRYEALANETKMAELRAIWWQA